jgi:choline-glycine betaine transporter
VAAGMHDRADQPLRHRKIRDRALILQLVGLILLMPPVAGVFHLNSTIAGLPFTVVYLFAVWAFLIAGAAALSRRLRDGDDFSGPAVAPDSADKIEPGA